MERGRSKEGKGERAKRSEQGEEGTEEMEGGTEWK